MWVTQAVFFRLFYHCIWSLKYRYIRRCVNAAECFVYPNNKGEKQRDLRGKSALINHMSTNSWTRDEARIHCPWEWMALAKQGKRAKRPLLHWLKWNSHFPPSLIAKTKNTVTKKKREICSSKMEGTRKLDKNNIQKPPSTSNWPLAPSILFYRLLYLNQAGSWI